METRRLSTEPYPQLVQPNHVKRRPRCWKACRHSCVFHYCIVVYFLILWWPDERVVMESFVVQWSTASRHGARTCMECWSWFDDHGIRQLSVAQLYSASTMSRPKHHIMTGCPLPFSISAATPYLHAMHLYIYRSSAFWRSNTVRIYVCMHDGKLVMPSNITCQPMYVCFYNSKHGKAVHPIYHVWAEQVPSRLEQNRVGYI